MTNSVKAEQLSVFLENRSGRLAEAIHAIAQAGINLRGISLADTSDFGILRLITDDAPGTEKILKTLGLTVGKTTVIGVEMPDTPGSLDRILQCLSRQGVNVEYMYAVAPRTPGRIVMVFRFDKVDTAIVALGAEADLTIIPATELG